MVRDDWTCQLCELAIPDLPAEEYNNILYGNCDHIIPRAVGGSGRRENLQAAHNFCNNLKPVHPNHGLLRNTRPISEKPWSCPGQSETHISRQDVLQTVPGMTGE